MRAALPTIFAALCRRADHDTLTRVRVSPQVGADDAQAPLGGTAGTNGRGGSARRARAAWRRRGVERAHHRRGTNVFTAVAGESNYVMLAPSPAGGDVVRLSELALDLQAGFGCVQVDKQTVDCPRRTRRISVNLGDGGDTLEVQGGSLPLSASGGDGNDDLLEYGTVPARSTAGRGTTTSSAASRLTRFRAAPAGTTCAATSSPTAGTSSRRRRAAATTCPWAAPTPTATPAGPSRHRLLCPRGRRFHCDDAAATAGGGRVGPRAGRGGRAAAAGRRGDHRRLRRRHAHRQPREQPARGPSCRATTRSRAIRAPTSSPAGATATRSSRATG